MIDLHTHSKYSRHGKGELADLVSQADKAGLKYLGISEHFPLPKDFIDPAGDSAMTWEDLPRYMQDLEKLSSQKVRILKSMEVDFNLRYIHDIKNELSKLSNLDYIIGSVHFINGWNFDFSKEVFEAGIESKDVDTVYEEYYYLIREMTKTDLFDIAAHLDLPKKFSYFPSKDVGLSKTLDYIADSGMVLEINTSGNHSL